MTKQGVIEDAALIHANLTEISHGKEKMSRGKIAHEDSSSCCHDLLDLRWIYQKNTPMSVITQFPARWSDKKKTLMWSWSILCIDYDEMASFAENILCIILSIR